MKRLGGGNAQFYKFFNAYKDRGYGELDKPGVYGFFDRASRRWLYIGQSQKSILRRICAHCNGEISPEFLYVGSRPRAAVFVYWWFTTNPLAIEEVAIAGLHPILNERKRPDKTAPFVSMRQIVPGKDKPRNRINNLKVGSYAWIDRGIFARRTRSGVVYGISYYENGRRILRTIGPTITLARHCLALEKARQNSGTA